jgi:hypothetical protein
MDSKVENQVKGTDRSQKTETKHASPPVVPMEVTLTLRISSLLVCNLLSDSRVIL